MVHEDDDQCTAEERLAVTAPFGRAWPGRAPTPAPSINPDEIAEQYARAFLDRNPQARLGLVAAPRGADALASAGWMGPANYDNDTATYAAVVRDWEDRFGARVIGAGSSTLHLSVAAPPARIEDALVVAAEHFTFCPDNIWQGSTRTWPPTPPTSSASTAGSSGGTEPGENGPGNGHVLDGQWLLPIPTAQHVSPPS
ncbi:DUF4253 domain-containing protein [Streptomyces sp. TLI_146]|uniref:DUF4253 domain-containing protein n=1 Tax=Streptomyces sp. TLI_146 TaxID=1938858 RepID=UPI00214AEAF3|nr:DUF4253 domain-containing protein [Streptomyces sp. TLI_146]